MPDVRLFSVFHPPPGQARDKEDRTNKERPGCAVLPSPDPVEPYLPDCCETQCLVMNGARTC